jgi:hypothetical protein
MNWALPRITTRGVYTRIATETPFSIADIATFFEEFIGKDVSDINVPIRVRLASDDVRNERCARRPHRMRITSAPVTNTALLAVGNDMLLVPVIGYRAPKLPRNGRIQDETRLIA